MNDMVTSRERRREYEARGSWDSSTLAEAVRRNALAAPETPAVVDETGAVRSRREVFDASELIAEHLRRHGTSAGDVVTVQLPNRWEAAVVAVAVQRLGAVINPVLPNYRRRELEHIWSRVRPTAVVTVARYRDFDHVGLVDELKQTVGVHPHHLVIGGPGGDAQFEDVLANVRPLGANHPMPAATGVSEVIFSSGTEATPKAILHSEQTANFSVRTARADLGVTDDDVVWMPSPVGHSTGFNYGLRFALYHGNLLVLQDRWDAAAALELVARYGCSYTLAATTFLADLVHALEQRNVRLDSLRLFGCGGAPVPPEMVARAEAVGIGVLRLYGSTEVLVATWNRPDSAAEWRASTDGLALTDVEVSVVSDTDEPVPPGTEGEIVVRGPNTSLGYFGDRERTDAVFLPSSWVRSGDLGRLDDHRNLTVVGRKKEIIIRGGLNIAPREIEELIVRFDEVDAVAVVGVPDSRLGEKMCACVVLRAGADLDLGEVTTRLRETGLATYKLPERLEVLDDLPMTPSGKVQKHMLVTRLQRTTSGSNASSATGPGDHG